MDNRVLQCKFIASMLAADGMMTTDEKAFLNDAMTALELSEDERDEVIAIDPDSDLIERARALPEPEKRAIIDLLVQAALADGKLSPYEMKMVKEVTAQLGLAP